MPKKIYPDPSTASDNTGVKVGVGVIILNNDGNILIGRRKGKHAQKYSIPGGGLEIGETFADAAIREIKEETNLFIQNPEVISITNNLETYREDGVHHVSVILLAQGFTGELKLMEPDKCEEWLWCDPHNLPKPLFDGCYRGVDMYLAKKFYKEYDAE